MAGGAGGGGERVMNQFKAATSLIDSRKKQKIKESKLHTKK